MKCVSLQRARLDANGFWGNHSFAAPAKESFPMVYNEFEVRRACDRRQSSIGLLAPCNGHHRALPRGRPPAAGLSDAAAHGGSCMPHASHGIEQLCPAAAAPRLTAQLIDCCRIRPVDKS